MSLEKREMSIGMLVLLVFLPATLVLLLYLGALNYRDSIPPLFSWTLIMIFVLFPFGLHVILRASKKEYGKYSLKSALVYDTRIALPKLLMKALIPFFMAGAVALLVGSFETRFMTSTVFGFVPEYFKIDDFINQTNLYPSTMILSTSILYVAANVVVLPVMEELYFRGFLMPRIERFGILAPIFITVLFSLYHFWAPWANIMRILAIFPYTYSVYKNKNIYIGILVHCTINLFSSAHMLFAVYGRNLR